MAAAPEKLAVDGVLLVYHRPYAPRVKDASTVREHVHAFAQHSSRRVWEVNTEFGFPAALADTEFEAILLHYSVFGMGDYALDQDWLDYLDGTSAHKIAFFQDECTRCQRRFAFLDRHRIDCVYTCLEPSEFPKVYGRYTSVSELVSNFPGYVSEKIVEAGRRYTVPFERRTVDVGYRGRTLPAYLGRGAIEKHDIGVRFRELAEGSGLRLDIATDEGGRLYGDAWYQFMASCRCVLGVESGVSAFDLEDEVLDEYNRRVALGLSVGIDDLETLPRWEDVVYYRTVSPRHFEAASLRVCQVLFEGRYSGVMEPMVHYIPLRKDFSNIDDVLAMCRDEALCRELAENAFRDLIASGAHTYERFVAGFDARLTTAVGTARPRAVAEKVVRRRLAVGARQRWRQRARWAYLAVVWWKPMSKLIVFAQPVITRVRRVLGGAYLRAWM
jgi:hypothetical protein